MAENFRFDSVKFDPERNIIVPNKIPDDPIIKENYEKYDFEDDIESYDKPAEKEEIANLQGEIEDEIARKAIELGISNKEDLDKFIKLANLDLGSLNNEVLAPLELKKGELKFIKENIKQSIDECWKSKITGRIIISSHVNSGKIIDFIEDHSKIVDFMQLLVLALSYGSPIFSSLAAEHASIDIGNEKISLADIMENPDMMKKIDLDRSAMSPLHVLEMDSLSDVSRISVVELKDFNPGKNMDIDGNYSKMLNKKIEIEEQYNVVNENGEFNPDNWIQANKVIEEWWEENREGNNKTFDEAWQEQEEKHKQQVGVSETFQKLKFNEMEISKSEEFDNFSREFLKVLEKHYTLKEMQEKNPQQRLTIVAEILCDNMDYDYNRAIVKFFAEAADDIPGPVGKYIGEKWNESENLRNVKGAPAASLESGKAICWDWAKTYVWALVALEEAGIDMKDVACCCTTSSDKAHTWVAFFAISPDGDKIIYSSGDPTGYEHHTYESSKEEDFDAVNENYYYGAVIDDNKLVVVDHVDSSGYYTDSGLSDNISSEMKKNVNKAHLMTLAEVKRHNIAALYEEWKCNLAQYDSQSYEAQHRIKLNKDAYEEMQRRAEKRKKQ